MKTPRGLLIFGILYLAAGFPLESDSSRDDFRFGRISMADGLSNNSVFCVLQDHHGFIWFGTFGGLNRFDGRNFAVYKPEPENPRSLTSSVIFALLEDSQSDLWIGTDGGGLNFFDRDREEFTSFRHDTDDPFSISGDQIFALAEDSMGWLWIGTGGSGLNRFDRERRVFHHYRKEPGADSLHSDVIRCIIEDSRGTVWIGTAGGGLSRYDRDTDTFTTWRHNPDDVSSLGSDTVRVLFEDAEGRLWVGTENGGLSLMDRSTGRFLRYINDPDNPESFQGTTVRAIVQDETGKIWAGTEKSGINIFLPESGIFRNVRETGDAKGLSGDRIRSLYVDQGGLLWICTRDTGINIYNPRSRDFSYLPTRHTARQIIQDESGNLWYGTDGGGLHRIDSRTGDLRVYVHDDDDPGSISSDLVYTVLLDGQGVIWAGTDGGGLNALEPGTGRITRFLHDPRNPGSLGSNVVWALFEDAKGALWVGTEGGGLNRYDSASRTFSRYRHDPKDRHSLNGNSVRSILEDSRGILWIGTWDGGLSRYRPESDDFEQFKRIPGDSSSLGDNSVNCVFEDSEGGIWVGTSGAGLNRMYGLTGNFSHVTRRDGLAGDNVFGILQDREGYLWISTDAGLSRYNAGNGTILNFGEADGLQKNEFSQNAYGKTRDGTIYVGGPRGYNSFIPEHIRGNQNVPPVLITEVALFGEPVSVGQKIHGYTVLKAPVSMTDRLELSWRDSVVSFTFAVLDYTDPGRNNFAMKIEGLQQNWTFLGTRHNAVVTSFRPGNYVLWVKGSNNNGIWNEAGTSLRIIVHPPFWETWWFRLIFSVSIIGIVLFLYKSRTRMLKMRASRMRNLSMHIQNAREEERTAAAREVHDELGQYLAVLKMDMYWTGNNLSADTEVLRRKTRDMMEVLDKTMEAVKSIATKLRPKVLDNLTFAEALGWQTRDFERHTGIACRLKIEPGDINLSAEAATDLFRMFQEILTNIIKHAGATSVAVNLFRENGQAHLEVADNGRGIRDEELKGEDSFGLIGLRERCSYLGGSVEIEGRPGKGTRVLVTVPLGGGEEC